MTAVKELFRQMIPDIEQNLPFMQDSDVQQFVNLWIKVKPEKKHAEIPFDPRYTEENRAERMARAFALSESIEIDEQAIKDLREASMI
jgi:hypothetical protein